jgi:hypothetical protein
MPGLRQPPGQLLRSQALSQLHWSEMYATNTCSAVLAVSTPAEGHWKRVTFTKAMMDIVEAFQEALDMRRVAHRVYFLSDE